MVLGKVADHPDAAEQPVHVARRQHQVEVVRAVALLDQPELAVRAQFSTMLATRQSWGSAVTTSAGTSF